MAARSIAMLACLALATPACATVHERRVGAPEVATDGQTVQSRVEQRSGKRYGTWKPYVAAALVGAVVASSAMIWVGFLDVNRPLSISGEVLVTTLPIAGAVLFLVKQDVPWARTKWGSWEPAPGIDARLQVHGDLGRVVATTHGASAADGTLRIELGDSLCRSGLQLGEDARVDLELTVRRADEPAITTVPTRGLGAPCPAQLSLMTGAAR